MRLRLLFFLLLNVCGGGILGQTGDLASSTTKPAKVFVIPIREDIMPPLTYVVRRGVKEAMEAQADLVVLDMETNGGRVDVTEEIIEVLGRFKGRTATFVNKKAFSAGAFISLATQRIFMAPQSVIGAAAPIMMSPGGTGVEQMPDTLEAKTVSAISALVRANAEKNGHNVEVADAMVKKTKELKIDGKVLNEKGQILTLTNREAEQEYGTPPRPLLSAGTVESVDELIKKLGFAQVARVNIEPLGAERVAFWITAISPLLLMVGIVGIYIEFKTPGFGLPGILGLSAFAIYFLGGYVAGLAGLEWAALFVLGLILVGLELFLFTGTIIPGVVGVLLILVSLIMAMADVYPGGPVLPTMPQLRLPLLQLAIAMAGSVVAILLLAKILPHTPAYSALVSQGVSGERVTEAREEKLQNLVGRVGVAVSPLRPGGKAQFGDEMVDVRTQGEMISKGTAVRVIAYNTGEAVVEAVV